MIIATLPQPARYNDDMVSQLADLFRLMGDPSRLSIVLCCLHEPVNVSGIVSSTGLSQPLVSHHLRLLRAARIVRSERRGKHVFYVAEDEHIQCVIEDMAIHITESVVQEE